MWIYDEISSVSGDIKQMKNSHFIAKPKTSFMKLPCKCEEGKETHMQPHQS